MTSEEKQKAIDALKISAPVIAVTQEEFNNYIQTLNQVMDWLEQEPKTGYWILQPSNKEQDERDFIWWKCSECGQVIFSETEKDRREYHAFCGKCGAKMVDKCRTCKSAFTTGKDRWYCKKSLADKDDCGEYEMVDPTCDTCEYNTASFNPCNACKDKSEYKRKESE